MKKKPIGFRGTDLLDDLINVLAPSIRKNKNDFITFCILDVAKRYAPVRYSEYLDGKILHIEVPGNGE